MTVTASLWHCAPAVHARLGEGQHGSAPAAPVPRGHVLTDGVGQSFAIYMFILLTTRPTIQDWTKGHSHPQSDKDDFRTMSS